MAFIFFIFNLSRLRGKSELTKGGDEGVKKISNRLSLWTKSDLIFLYFFLSSRLREEGEVKVGWGVISSWGVDEEGGEEERG